MATPGPERYDKIRQSVADEKNSPLCYRGFCTSLNVLISVTFSFPPGRLPPFRSGLMSNQQRLARNGQVRGRPLSREDPQYTSWSSLAIATPRKTTCNATGLVGSTRLFRTSARHIKCICTKLTIGEAQDTEMTVVPGFSPASTCDPCNPGFRTPLQHDANSLNNVNNRHLVESSALSLLEASQTHNHSSECDLSSEPNLGNRFSPTNSRRKQARGKNAPDTDSSKPFLCTLCETGFEQLQEEKNHLIKEICCSGVVFVCKVAWCQLWFRSKELFRVHANECHDKETHREIREPHKLCRERLAFGCRDCGQCFVRVNEKSAKQCYLDHVGEMHVGAEGKKVQCGTGIGDPFDQIRALLKQPSLSALMSELGVGATSFSLLRWTYPVKHLFGTAAQLEFGMGDGTNDTACATCGMSDARQRRFVEQVVEDGRRHLQKASRKKPAMTGDAAHLLDLQGPPSSSAPTMSDSAEFGALEPEYFTFGVQGFF